MKTTSPKMKTMSENFLRSLAMIFLFSAISTITFAGGNEKEGKNKKEKKCIVSESTSSSETEEGLWFWNPNKYPSFPGGVDALITFIQSNISYPERCKELGVTGTVKVSFYVEEDGSISDIKIKEGIFSELDIEASRVVSSMPNWIPGKRQNEKVKMEMVLPIQFSLD